MLMPYALPSNGGQHIDMEEQPSRSDVAAAPLDHDDDETVPSKALTSSQSHPRSRTIFINFMSYHHEKTKPYPQDHEFTVEDFMTVTPQNICDYLAIVAFGKANPNESTKLISNYSRVDFVRGAIRHHLPKENNPAASDEVKTFMERIRSLTGIKEVNPTHTSSENGSAEATDGVTTIQMLRKMHSRNTQFLNIIQSMDSTIRTLTKTMNKMKKTLESNNLQIQNEMVEGAEENGESLSMDHSETISLMNKFKEEENSIAAALDNLTGNKEDPAAGPPLIRTSSMTLGTDGYCTFYNGDNKPLYFPEGFDLPTCDLNEAWTAWLTGFPKHKFRVKKSTEDSDVEAVVDAPIKPLRDMRLGCIPQSLKKKYKDGWRPILQYMTAGVENMLSGVSPSKMDEKFINSSFAAAKQALMDNAPEILEGKIDKFKTWKVATWSRKIREHTANKRRTLKGNDRVKEGETKDDDVAMTET